MHTLPSESSALHMRFPCLATAPAVLIVKVMAQRSGFATMFCLLEEVNT